MSMATYIGLNFAVKLNEFYTEDEVEIDLNNLQIEATDIYEKCFIRIEN